MADDELTLGHGTGPLRGLKVVEIAGIGPGPHACTLLADLGADVIRIDRPGGGGLTVGPREADLLARGRPSVALDLKSPRGVATVLDLVQSADVLVEGLRPGAMERLGLGPDECLGRNPRLVYGRMTGWGQSGPLAHTAGHDMTYLGVSGVLHGLGQDRSRPHFPSNLLGDFGGGSLYLVVGVLAAVWEAGRSGRGQVVDAAIVDGAAHLATMTASMLAGGVLAERRASNFLDGGMPFYDVYETADGEHVAVGPLEPQFYDEFLRLIGLAETAPDRWDPSTHGELRRLVAERLASRTRDEWAATFADTDGCVAPVLRISEAAQHPHMVARGTWVERDGHLEPAPAPRFSRTQARLGLRPTAVGARTASALRAWGVADVDGLLACGAAVQA